MSTSTISSKLKSGQLPNVFKLQQKSKNSAPSPADTTTLEATDREEPNLASTPPRDAHSRPLDFHLSRDLSGERQGSRPIMAAEEADVDIEGDVVAAAAQPG